MTTNQQHIDSESRRNYAQWQLESILLSHRIVVPEGEPVAIPEELKVPVRFRKGESGLEPCPAEPDDLRTTMEMFHYMDATTSPNLWPLDVRYKWMLTRHVANTTKSKKNVLWWRDLPESEIAVTARACVQGQNYAAVAISKIFGPQIPEQSATAIAESAKYLEPWLTDVSAWLDTNNIPFLFATIYSTRPHGVKTMQTALAGKALIELAAMVLESKEAPIVPLMSAVEELPDGTDLSTLTQGVHTAVTASLQMPRTTSSLNVAIPAIDIWIKKLTGASFQEFLEPEAIVLGTSKLLGHQQIFITNRKEYLDQRLSLTERNQSYSLKACSWVDLPDSVERPDSEELLERMQQTLVRYKVEAEATSLLKTHLYLVNRAFEQGGQTPLITIEMEDLLAAKGYKRRDDEGFHPQTCREEYRRLIMLTGCWLEVGKVTGKSGKKSQMYIDETPYWKIEARRKLQEGDIMGGLQPVLLGNPDIPIVKSLLIRPGLWWQMSDIGKYRISLPQGILALPIDGQGNKTERIAVQIAATLAVWVRSSQNQHAGTSINYSVGKLLEASGVLSRSEFEKINRKDLARVRTYLAGSPGDDKSQGAINILAKLNAFDVSIGDENDFWMSGRGWKNHFWEARLCVRIPDLEIQKTPKRTRR